MSSMSRPRPHRWLADTSSSWRAFNRMPSMKQVFLVDMWLRRRQGPSSGEVLHYL